MSRESILHRVRTALGRGAVLAISEPPAVRLRVPTVDAETRIATTLRCVEALAGNASCGGYGGRRARFRGSRAGRAERGGAAPNVATHRRNKNNRRLL